MKGGILVLLAAVIVSVVILLVITPVITPHESRPVPPVRIAIMMPDPCEMVAGESRIVEIRWFSGRDNLEKPDFSSVTERDIVFTITPPGSAIIDQYGRLDALRPGNVTLTAAWRQDPAISDSRNLSIVSIASRVNGTVGQVVRYTGVPSPLAGNLQKLVERPAKAEIAQRDDIPAAVREASLKPPLNWSGSVQSGNATWTIVPFFDGSNRRYVQRNDLALPDDSRDRVQYFMGDRYLPDRGDDPVFIKEDGENGVWVIAGSGNVTRIRMVAIPGDEKAVLMSDTTEHVVSRLGFVSGASWDGTAWTPEISDNDGLWTSLYGAGELMRYAVLRENGTGSSREAVQSARVSALGHLKAVLLLARISGREGTVSATIRHLNNTRLGQGNRLSEEYLKEGRVYAILNSPQSPADATGLFGNDAGSVSAGRYTGGTCRFSLGPVRMEDWTTSGPAATTNRTLKGFIARTVSLSAIEKTPFHDGIFFWRNANGTQTVLSHAERLYGYTADDHPVLDIGDAPLPPLLDDVLIVNGTQYTTRDIAYKADTSTDELIGHIFLYKTAYDILDENDPEEKELRELVRATVLDLAQHMTANGYQLTDATGQGTSWGKISHDYLTSDYAIEDNSLNSLVLLATYKLAYYVSGETRWQDEYRMLATGTGYQYADLAGKYWDHWTWLATNEDSDPDSGIYRLDSNASPVELRRHIQYSLNYSDEEMAMMAYYLLFQMENDPVLLTKYRDGLAAWWQSISLSGNPLWYEVYQLAYPAEPQIDDYGHDLLSTASWALSRHPVDTRRTQAYIPGSRPDLIDDCGLSVRPGAIIGERTSPTDTLCASSDLNTRVDPSYDPRLIYRISVLPQDERALHKFNAASFTDIGASESGTMEPATTYTLPYWFGRYHHLLAEV